MGDLILIWGPNVIMQLFWLPVDCGDYVIVTNSRNVKVTGRKSEQLLFRKHSMYPGGLKETPYRDMMSDKPDEVRCSGAITTDTH